MARSDYTIAKTKAEERQSSSAHSSSAELSHEFREELADLEIPPEQAEEFLSILWNILCQFADFGFGLGPTYGDNPEKTAQEFSRASFDVVSLIHQLATPHERVAPRLTLQTEEQQ